MEDHQPSRCKLTNKAILNYLGVTCCPMKNHIKRRRCYCKKESKWICQQCKQNSYYLCYVYTNNRISTYCILHYQKHFQVLIHYIKGNVVTLYDPITKTKKNVTLNKSINSNADSISVGNRIFIIGASPASSEMHEVDFKNNTLIQKKSMLTPKCSHTLCNANDFIYSIGGYNDSTSISDCEKYSMSQNNWKALPALQTARCGCAAFTLNDTHIYCLCGSNNGTYLNSMEMMSVVW